MKSKLLKLTVAAFVAMSTFMHAQTAPATLGPHIVYETFENWSGASPNVPTDWEIAPANTIPSSNVAQVVTTSTAVAVQSGIYSCKLVNTVASYSTGCFASVPVAVTAGTGYQISYYARGKGTINVEITDGSAATSTVNYATTNGQSVSGKAWHHYFQTVTAPTTTNNAQFCLRVKSTTTYTAAGGISITGIDVDSFVVQPYTITPSANLYSLQYTTASNGNSPFFGQSVLKTGGIVTAQILSSSGGYSGYYIQTSGANAWAAGYVYDQTNTPSVGDSVTFGCSVDEYYNMTELVSINNFVDVTTTQSLTPKILPSVALNSSTMAAEMYESMLINIQNATVQSYSANYGQGTISTNAGVDPPCTYDFKSGFYAPNGSATSGSTGNPGYTPVAPYPSNTPMCVTGNVNYEFSAYNIVPRDSADIKLNCTVLGIEKHNSVGANVYPNPMANELNIQLPFAANTVSVSISDIMGREVVAPVTTSGTMVNINNLNLNAGTYFVKITADGKTQITKVIK
jgi:hypothetical protein